MKKNGRELIAIAHHSSLFGASGQRHVATDNFLAISCWLLAISVSLNLVGFRIWCFPLAGTRFNEAIDQTLKGTEMTIPDGISRVFP